MLPAFSLAALAKDKGLRKDKILRPIKPTAAQGNEFVSVYLDPVRAQAARLRETIIPAYADAGDAGPGTLRAQLGADDTEMQRDIAIAGAGITPFLTRTEAWQLSTWRGVVQAGVGVDVGPMTLGSDAADSLEAAAERSAALLRGSLEEFRKRIDTILWNGIAQDKTRAQITQELTAALDIATSRARNTASDQLYSFVAELNQFRQVQAGVDVYIWSHTPQLNPRWWHEARDGQPFNWDRPPYDGPPGTLPYCKCVAEALVEGS